MKLYSTKFLNPSLFLGIFLSISLFCFESLAQVQGTDLFQFTVQPRLTFMFDNSGSMGGGDFTTVCACYDGDGSPGNPIQYDCDENAGNDPGRAGTKNDMLVGTIRRFLDANDTSQRPGYCSGHRDTVDINDDRGLEYGFFHFGDINSMIPVPSPTIENCTNEPPNDWIDCEHIRHDPPSDPDPGPETNGFNFPNSLPSINYQTWCDSSGGADLIYRERRTDSEYQLNRFINTMRPGGLTPILFSLLYMHTDDEAYLNLASTDSAWACRQDAIVMIADGADTCLFSTDFDDIFDIDEHDLPEKAVEYTIDAAEGLYNLVGVPQKDPPNDKIKGYFVGMTDGLKGIGQLILNVAAQTMGTDADGDEDGLADTYCDPMKSDLAGGPGFNFGRNNNNDPNILCDFCTLKESDSVCPGNAFFVGTPEELTSTLETIASELQSGEYTVSPPTLALSGSGEQELLVSYWGVNDDIDGDMNPGQPAPVWSGHLENRRDDDGDGEFTDYKYETVFKIPAQNQARKLYTIDSGDNLIAFNDSNITNGTIDWNSFFPDPHPDNDFNMDPDGDVDEYDARDIVRWMSARATAGEDQSYDPDVNNLTWKNGDDYNPAMWPTGSIVHGFPTLVGNPNNITKLLQPGYIEYIEETDRERIALFPTNNGCISAIWDPDPLSTNPLSGYQIGEELWAYCPLYHRPRLRHLRSETNLYNDGFWQRSDILVNPGAVTPKWQTRAVMGLGFGGNGVIGLNLTKTSDFYLQDQSLTEDRNWEFTDNLLGFTTGRISFMEVKDNSGQPVTIAVVPGGEYIGLDPDNARYIFFLDPVLGTLKSKKEVIPLIANTANGGHLYYPSVDPPGPVLLPTGMETRPALVDTNSDGYTDKIFIGTNVGDIYRIDVDNLLERIDGDAVNEAQPVAIWQARDLSGATPGNPFNDFGGNNNLSLNCNAAPPPPNCTGDAAGKRDLRVEAIIPYFPTTDPTSLRLVVFFGDPFEGDDNNLPNTEHPRGQIIRVINPDPSSFGHYVEWVHPNIGGADADAFTHGPPNTPSPGTRLPREIPVTPNGEPWRVLSADKAFVAFNKLFYILFEPLDTTCEVSGSSYFACLDLENGKDCDPNTGGDIDPLDLTNDPLQNLRQNSILITNTGPASMVVDFLRGEIIVGFPTDQGVQVRKLDTDLPLPESGPAGHFINTTMQ